jgi:hypothetical protein
MKTISKYIAAVDIYIYLSIDCRNLKLFTNIYIHTYASKLLGNIIYNAYIYICIYIYISMQ